MTRGVKEDINEVAKSGAQSVHIVIPTSDLHIEHKLRKTRADILRMVEEGMLVARELALVKVSTADSKARSDLIHYVNIFRGRIVDISTTSAIVEITGDSAKIDAFIDLVTHLGIKEVARTGIVALSRGSKSIVEVK